MVSISINFDIRRKYRFFYFLHLLYNIDIDVKNVSNQRDQLFYGQHKEISCASTLSAPCLPLSVRNM